MYINQLLLRLVHFVVALRASPRNPFKNFFSSLNLLKKIYHYYSLCF